MDSAYKANKIKELHSNVRHITQLGMSWFAFFVTVNYLTMSWLAAKGPNNQGVARSMILGVAIVFMVQDFLGIFGLLGVIRTAMAMKLQIDKLENDSQKGESEPEVVPAMRFKLHQPLRSLEKSKSESTPVELYKLIGLFLMIVLGSLMVAWARIWWITFRTAG